VRNRNWIEGWQAVPGVSVMDAMARSRLNLPRDE